MSTRYRSFLKDHYGIDPDTITSIDIGVANRNYLITAGSSRYIFKRSTSTAKYPNTNIVSFLAAAQNSKLPLIQIIPSRTGEPFLKRGRITYTLATFLPGTHPTYSTITTGKLRSLGSALATLHLLPWQAAITNPKLNPSYMERVYRRYLPLLERKSFDSKQEFLGTVENERQHTTSRLAAWQALPRTPVHNDPYLSNTLFEGDELTGLLDLEDVGTGIALIDVARVINTWCFTETGTYRPELAKAFVAGYDAARPLSPLERELFYDLLRFVAYRHCVWFMKLCVQRAAEPASAIDYYALRFWRAHPDAAIDLLPRP
jgi:homoserine kinase type II